MVQQTAFGGWLNSFEESALRPPRSSRLFTQGAASSLLTLDTTPPGEAEGGEGAFFGSARPRGKEKHMLGNMGNVLINVVWVYTNHW